MKGQTRVENILKIILFSSFSLLSLLTLLFSCFMLYMNKKVQSDLYFGLISTILGLFFPSPITSFNIRNRHNNKIDNIIKLGLYITFFLICLTFCIFSFIMLYSNIGNSEQYVGLISIILGLFFPSPLNTINVINDDKQIKIQNDDIDDSESI